MKSSSGCFCGGELSCASSVQQAIRRGLKGETLALEDFQGMRMIERLQQNWRIKMRRFKDKVLPLRPRRIACWTEDAQESSPPQKHPEDDFIIIFVVSFDKCFI